MALPLFEQLSLFRSEPPRAGNANETSRHIHLSNRIVEYSLRQAPRRRLSLAIDERGLRVAAPRSISVAEIEAFIRANAEWVLKKIDAYAGRPRRQIAIRDGERIPVLGQEVQLCVVSGSNRVHWQMAIADSPELLVLAARRNADLEALARRALQRRALSLFATRIEHYRHHVNRPVPPLALSSARTRWGSCSINGIRLNWRLIHLPLPIIDYVVAHELAHLEQMNHSPRFWAVVERMYPDYKAARSELKRMSLDVPVF